MKSWDAEFTRHLLSCERYRDVLAAFFKEGRQNETLRRVQHPRVLSFAEFSRRAGFRSRAYGRDILHGSKRVNRSNFEAVCRALKLTDRFKDFFGALVELEENANLEADRRQQLQKKIEKIRRQLLSSLQKLKVDGTTGNIARRTFVLAEVPLVYAASGTVSEGASLEEIKARTRLPNAKLLPTIKALEEVQLLSERDGRYYPSNLYLHFDKLSNEDFFRQDYLRSLVTARDRFMLQRQSHHSLFLNSNFCVREERLPELRERLKQLLLDFVEEGEEARGDSIAEFCVAFSSNSPQTLEATC